LENEAPAGPTPEVVGYEYAGVGTRQLATGIYGCFQKNSLMARV